MPESSVQRNSNSGGYDNVEPNSDQLSAAIAKMPQSFGASAPFSEPLWYSRDDSPYYNDSHRHLRAETRKYIDTYVSPYVAEWEAKGSIPAEAFERHAEFGYMAACLYPLPKDYLDGKKMPAGVPADEWDAFHDMIVIDEIARCGYLGLVWGFTCGNSVGVPPLINYGTHEQKKRFIPDVVKGNIIFSLGITEPDVGSDVANLKTTAQRKGNKYIVNGMKKWITNGIWADYITAAVRTGGKGPNGVSALIIPLTAKGVSRRKMENSGVNCSGSTFIEFDDVEVPVENLIGKENEGFKIIMSNFNHERLWLACTSLRLARVCAEDAYKYAITRETFGKPLIENQMIRAKIAGFGRTIDPTYAYMESLLYLVNRQQPQDPQLGGLWANLKVTAGRTLEQVNREAQQIMGGAGYTKSGKGMRIEQISRDLRPLVVGGGSDEILTELVVRQEMAALKTRASKL